MRGGVGLVCAAGGDAGGLQCLHDGRLIGYRVYTAAELKTIQEVVTLTVFGVFSVVWLKEPITLNHVLGFALIALGAGIIFRAPF